MSSKVSSESKTTSEVENIYQHNHVTFSSSSSDPPIEDWSSLFEIEVPDSRKMVLFKQGLYDPGIGEVCAEYIPLSDSDVYQHVYYNYPGIEDPGVLDALYKPEKKKVYNINGQDLYLDLCEEMNVVPVRSFHRGLLKHIIDLRYYCVNPVGVRAMCLSLALNNHVRRLDLTSNFLDDDACYHLGQLLAENNTLTELILSQCKLKPEGLKKVVVRLAARSMDLLDLSKNNLGDRGFEFLAAQILKGAVIKRLSLSNNDLTSLSALSFAEAIEGNTSITHLDLSWNKLYPPKGINDLLRRLGDSNKLTELHLPWNGLTIGLALRKVLTIPTLRVLDLSHNRLSTPAAKAVYARLHMSKKLQTLDLSQNPFSPADALLMLQKMREKEVVLQNLYLDDVIVSKEFAEALNEVLALSYREKCKITHGSVTRDYTLSVPDLRAIVMRRLHFLTESTEKCTLDMVLYFLKEYKVREEPKLLQPRELMRALKNHGAPLDDGLIEEFVRAFPGPKMEKGGNTIMLQKVVDYIKRLWPEKQLPPTPPEPAPEPKKKAAKGKKKKK